MADELFNVIFRGDTVAGHNLVDVKARFAQLFKMDPAKVEGFFAGKPVVLKANCDRATGDKFKAALENAGAIVEVRSVAPAAPVPAPVAAPVAATPAPVVKAPVSAPTTPAAPPPPQATPQPRAAEPANPWSLAATGSDLLRANEINQAEPVQVDISKVSLVKHNPFSTDAEEPLEAARHVSAPPLDLSNLKLGEVGETLVEFKEFVPKNIDLSELSLAAPGADVLREDERQQFVPANVDTSSMDIAPAGGDLGQIKPPPPPPAPSTDHLSVNK
jgi:hypothetical protein